MTTTQQQTTVGNNVLGQSSNNNSAAPSLHVPMKNVIAAPPNVAPKRAFTCLADLTGATALPREVTTVPNELLEKYPHTKRVGNYLLGKTLGEGSFAKVREGLHTITGEKVAIKVIDKRRAKEDSYVHRNLRREGRILQLVRHPCIIHLYDILETENSYYLVMELCTGGDMMEYLKLRKSLPEKETRKYIRQIISAVDHLHRAGILHRDLKVENVLLDEKKNIKLIDFGLSRHFKLDENNVLGDYQQATQCGSPAYAAPELLGKNKYGPKVDIWSIGVNMYAMLTGSLPFTAEPFSIKVLYQKMMNFDINPIPDHITTGCVELLKKLLNPDPTQRISMDKLMQNEWINEGYKQKLCPAPFPNKIKAESLNKAILEFMDDKFQMSSSQTVKVLLQNQSCSMFSVYHLLIKRLHNYMNRAGSLIGIQPPVVAGNSSGIDGNNNNINNNQIRRIEPPSADVRFANVTVANAGGGINNDHQNNNNTNNNNNNNTQINEDCDVKPGVINENGRNGQGSSDANNNNSTTNNINNSTPQQQQKVVQFNKLSLGMGPRANTSPEVNKKSPPTSPLKYPGMHTDRRAMERQTKHSQQQHPGGGGSPEVILRQRQSLFNSVDTSVGGGNNNGHENNNNAHRDRCKTSTYNKSNAPAVLLERNRPVTGRGRLDKTSGHLQQQQQGGGSLNRRPVSLNRASVGNGGAFNRSSNEFNGDIRGRGASAINNNNNNNAGVGAVPAFDQTFKPVGILKRVTQPRLFRAQTKEFSNNGGGAENEAHANKMQSMNGRPYENSASPAGTLKRNSAATAGGGSNPTSAAGNRANTANPTSNIYKWTGNNNTSNNQQTKTKAGSINSAVANSGDNNNSSNSPTLPSINSPKTVSGPVRPIQITTGSDRPKTSSV